MNCDVASVWRVSCDLCDVVLRRNVYGCLDRASTNGASVLGNLELKRCTGIVFTEFLW
jgi:hypothetical protein